MEISQSRSAQEIERRTDSDREERPLRTWLVFSVISAVFLFPPLGVAAIVCSARAYYLRRQGEQSRAKKAAKTAFSLCVASSAAALIALLYALLIRA